jgi:hypothetical protein
MYYSGLVHANVAIIGTDSCLHHRISLHNGPLGGPTTADVQINDCTGGTICINTYDIFGSNETIINSDCASLNDGDFASALVVQIVWATDHSGARVSTKVPALGIDLLSELDNNWYRWQRITSVQFEAGNQNSLDTKVELSELRVENSESAAVNCTGSWTEHSSSCVLAYADRATLTDSALESLCGHGDDSMDGQIISTFLVDSPLSGVNGGNVVCNNDPSLHNGKQEFSQCNVDVACNNVMCAAITTATVVGETLVNQSWLTGSDRSLYLTGNQLLDGDPYHDWSVSRLNGPDTALTGGAFVIVAPSNETQTARAIISSYSIRGSLRTNLTSTDPFEWKLYTYIGSEYVAANWESISDSEWVLLDEQSDKFISDSPGGEMVFNLTQSWISLTNNTSGGRAFKFLVERTRGSDDTGTQAEELAMSELTLFQCANFDDFLDSSGGKPLLALPV